MAETSKLFTKENYAGVFKGFTAGGLEFHADLVLPYKSEFQCSPMHGQFLLVQLETPEEAVLGRITSFSAEGKLSYGAGEEFNIRAMEEGREIPEELRENYLRYKVNIRVLGVVRADQAARFQFVPSIRRLPHVGSPVAFPGGEILRALTGHHNKNSAAIGHFALGEYIYHGIQATLAEPWMQSREPETFVRFPIESLVSRRTFVFARAGFGKSNLTKLLFSTLYESDPTVEKRNGKQVPVGTIIFDPDGEYFWPDDKGRPGLCDVPHLEKKIVVFTNRKSTSPFYQSFAAGGVKLDIRRLPPGDVISIALSPEKQDQQNVRKLRGLGFDGWNRLVNLINENHNQSDLEEISQILGLESEKQQAEALAARANMSAIVRMLHDPTSRLIDYLMKSLEHGKLCVIDISQMRGSQGMILAGIIMRTIFDHNQMQFTEAEPRTYPTITVVEEAQSVLDQHSSASEPFIAWVKEGRKYDLGAMMITQQPGSITTDILSQGDNWFVFHLLSASDLQVLHKANAHYSEDILGALLNEPIKGHCVFWSSADDKAYPLSTRILSFEEKYSQIDAKYSKAAGNTFAKFLHDSSIAADSAYTPDIDSKNQDEPAAEEPPQDRIEDLKKKIIDSIRADPFIMEKLASQDGYAYGSMKAKIFKILPRDTHDRESFSYQLVPTVMNELTESIGKKWKTVRRSNSQGKTTSYIHFE